MVTLQQNFKFKINNISLHKYKCLIILCMLAMLLGCAHISETFDCKFEKGVGCRSITEVNQMVNRGEIKGISSEEENSIFQSPVYISSASKASVNSEQTTIQRIQEQHLRVWLAPFQDEQGNFHEASIVHTVLKPGY